VEQGDIGIERATGPRAERARLLLTRHMAGEGLKHTRQRELVLEVFLHSTGHLTVQELTDHVKELDPSVGLTTVYRTLRLLVDASVAEERHFTDGQARYEVAELGTHHDHLICTTCGQIFEFEDDAIEARQSEIAAAHGLKIRDHRHEIYAECESPQDCSYRAAIEKGRIP
jgi:Fur family ferric uptake transcriptional regulator